MCNKVECLQVIWKDLETRQRVAIGTLCKGDNYVFAYNQATLSKAKKLGFKGLVAFQDIEKEYVSSVLFPAFATRLPDRRRSDIQVILEKYGLSEYNAFELLKKTEGRLPIDTLEFIETIDLNKITSNSSVEKIFFVAGVRHCEACDDKKGDNCTLKIPFNIGESLTLVLDTENPFDSNAVMLYKGDKKVGFVPNYYSKAIHDAIIGKFKLKCIVKEFNNQSSCQECLKVALTIEKE